MLKEAIEAYPDPGLSFFVIWLPMLPSDNEAAAREVSGLFDDPRVRQFYDPGRLVGISYSRDIFPDSIKHAVASLPEGHFLKDRLAPAVGAPPEQRPIWDAAFFYDAGSRWEEQTPVPQRWSKQVLFYGEGGLFWTNSFREPPVESGWFAQIKQQMSRWGLDVPQTGEAPAPALPLRPEPDLQEDDQDVREMESVATLGVTTRAPKPEETKRHQLPGRIRTQGQVVVDVEPGGAAEAAGVLTGDVLMRFGRDALFSQDDIRDLVRASTPGDSIELEIADGETSKRRTASIELGSKRVELATKPRLAWDLAGLAQLEDALERAEGEHKLVLVGLSGAET